MSAHPQLDGDSRARIAWRPRSTWRAFVGRLPDSRTRQRLSIVFGLWLAVVLIYWPSSKALAGFWSDTADRAYTHGYLVLLVALGLVVRERAALAAAAVRPDPRALVPLLFVSAAWVWFYHAAVQDLHLLLLPLLLLLALLSVFGLQATRALVFPIGFLYFAMPVWSDLVGVLQSLSIRANSALIWLTGLPAYITGDTVHVPAGTLEIAGGCSGLHSLVVGLALAAFYGELARDPLRWRLTWVGLMAALAIAGNWIRIFVIIAAAEASDMQTFLVTVDHYWFGWGVFLLCFLCFLWLAGRLRGPGSARPAAAAQAAEESVAGSTAGVLRSAVAAGLLLAVLPALLYATEPLRTPTRPIDIVWRSAPYGWQGPAPVAVETWKPLFANANVVSHRQYWDRDARLIEVFIAAYDRQQQGAKLLGYGNSLLSADAPGELLDEQIVQTPSGAWDQATFLDASGQRALIWSRYDIGGRSFVRPRWGQLWYGLATLSAPVISSITAMRAICQPDCDATRKRLLGVAAGLEPSAQFERVRH